VDEHPPIIMIRDIKGDKIEEVKISGQLAYHKFNLILFATTISKN
jgi:hypothetical protein